MSPDNHAQAYTPKDSYDEEIVTSPRIHENPPQATIPALKKPMNSPSDVVRASLYICLALLVLSLLFLYEYNTPKRILLPESDVEHDVQGGSMTEDEQLDNAITALSLAGSLPKGAIEPSSIMVVKTLDHPFIPQVGPRISQENGLQGRLIIIGDIHGMKSELEQLLAKLAFDSHRDHILSVGDMINKGPDSVGVLDLLMRLGASAVRGNHEDGVLRAWDKMQSKSASVAQGSDSEAGGVIDGRGKKHKFKMVAKQLTTKHVEWLKGLPLILKLGYIKGMGEVVVVHAGLMPGLKLKRQEPQTVMSIRTINLKKLIPSESHKWCAWTKLWNKYQLNLPEKERMTVIYGHNARRGLAIEQFAKGIDTGCVNGGKLTAFVIEGGEREVKTSLVDVGCNEES